MDGLNDIVSPLYIIVHSSGSRGVSIRAPQPHAQRCVTIECLIETYRTPSLRFLVMGTSSTNSVLYFLGFILVFDIIVIDSINAEVFLFSISIKPQHLFPFDY